jgi:hypothetical protein
VSQRIWICGTGMGASRSISSQHTPVMNEWCWHLFINQVVALILGYDEEIGNIVFDVVIIVDWDVHEIAAVEAERASLFRFGEDIHPHNFCWA